MCVIALKKRKVQIDIKTLDLMFEQNPDGAGFALIQDKKVTISKGYFNVDSLWTDIKHMQKERLVLHFRIATSGGINVPMCHPFIVDSNLKLATSIYEETEKPVLFHNGMISNFGSTKISDTCDFAINALAHIPTLEAQLQILKLANTKFIFIRDGTVYKIGTFYKYKGLSVSNDHFVPRPVATKPTSKFSNAPANTLGFGRNHVSTNEDLHDALKNLDGIADNAMSEQEYADALDSLDGYEDYFYEEGKLVKKPEPIFDSASGCYYEYDHEFDTYNKKCR